MANNNPPSIKDNPFKRLDALRTKVSGVKSPAPAAAGDRLYHRQAREGSGVGDPGGARDDRGRPADDDRARKEEGLHVLVPAFTDGRSQAEDLQAAEEALEYRH